MKLLLDTHAFLWWAADDPRLPGRARRAIGNARNDVCLSVVTAWEIVSKAQAGRLEFADPPDRFIATRFRQYDFPVLPLTLPHVLRVAQLPFHHADPFDRALIAQAMVERRALVTADDTIGLYDVRVLWD